MPNCCNANTMHLYFVDIDNRVSFSKYIGEIKIGRGDKIIVFDSKTTQFIYEKKVTTTNQAKKYSKKKFLERKVNNHIDMFCDVKDKKIDQKQNYLALNKQKNDFARQLKTISDYIITYRESYSKIKIIFFGESYIRDAYNHNFNEGIPSDGFIFLNDSEFNTFPDIVSKNVEFSIMYDNDPFSSSVKLFRFYTKLLSKKFSARLYSFNNNATLNAKPELEEINKPFFENIIRVIGQPSSDDCGSEDKINVNNIPDLAKIEIMIENPCRKNTILTFSHNGELIQVTVDKDGRATVILKKVAGTNIIKYINLKGDWIDIINEDAHQRQNEFEFDVDNATKTVYIKGRNPLRIEGSYVSMLYENTGAIYNLKVKNGKFEKRVPISAGKNVFKWKDMNGEDHEIVITHQTKCTDQIKFDDKIAEEYGVFQVTLYNKCRENGSIVKFFYDHKEYSSIVIDGKATSVIILKYDVNDIFYENFDRNNTKLATIKINDFHDLIRFSISYKDNIVALMNIYETNINPNVPVYSFDYTNRKLDKEGHIHIDNRESTFGKLLTSKYILEIPALQEYLDPRTIRTYTQVYVTRKSKQTLGDIYFYVDYLSRHGTYWDQLPLCGKRSFGGIIVDYEILYNGSTEKGEKFLNPSNCINNMPTNEDSKMILIKRLKIR